MRQLAASVQYLPQPMRYAAVRDAPPPRRRSTEVTLPACTVMTTSFAITALVRYNDSLMNSKTTTMSGVVCGDVSWERMIRAVERVRERVLRTAAALDKAGVPYAVAGGNAVAAWVSRVDEAAVRNTQDVDIVLRRMDLDTAAEAMNAAGFVRRHSASIDMFLDGPDARARDAVHVVFAGEKVRPEYALPAPDVTESESAASFQVLTLDALVRMKLTSFRDKDRTHLRDLIDVGLIDETWCSRLPKEIAPRLRHLLDHPED